MVCLVLSSYICFLSFCVNVLFPLKLLKPFFFFRNEPLTTKNLDIFFPPSVGDLYIHVTNWGRVIA